MKISLGRRIFWGQSIAYLILAITVPIATIVTAYSGGPSDFDAVLRGYGQTLASIIKGESDFDRIQSLVRVVQRGDEETTLFDYLPRGEYQANYQVLNLQTNELVFRSPSTPMVPFPIHGNGFEAVEVNGRRWRVYAVDNKADRIRVMVAESLELRRRIIFSNLKLMPIEYLIILGAFAFSTWIVTKITMRPLMRLADQVRRRPADDLRALEPEVEISEVTPLLNALNIQMRKAAELLKAQRQFVADAAHSLRTPLAVIEVQAHALVGAVDDRDREELATALRGGVERATVVVKQLLSEARLESKSQMLEIAKVDVGSLFRDRISQLLPLAVEMEHDLGVELPDSLIWDADSALLATLVDNLLENSLRHTPVGTTITLRAWRDDANLWCEVEDNGFGIPEGFRASAFDRFARGPGATAPGSGLGLSIVKRVVDLHGGIVELGVPTSGNGLKVKFSIPRPE